MTKDKARKRAVRERAATTGERYVVARRAVEHERGAAHDGILHRLTHLVPGVPEHVEGGRAAGRNRPHRDRTHRNRPHRPSARLQPRHGEPRVLVAWQRRIARLLHAD